MEPTSLVMLAANALTVERELQQRIREHHDRNVASNRLAPVGDISPVRGRYPIIGVGRLSEYFTHTRQSTHGLQAPGIDTLMDTRLY